VPAPILIRVATRRAQLSREFANLKQDVVHESELLSANLMITMSGLQRMTGTAHAYFDYKKCRWADKV
jgi:hypothetical protein